MKTQRRTEPDNLSPKTDRLDQERATDVPKGEPQRGEGNPPEGQENQDPAPAQE